MIDDLATQSCAPCNGNMTALGSGAIAHFLLQLPDWELSEDGKVITREFKFKGFLRTMSFINAMAWVANQENHHPDFSAGFNYCRVGFTTHDISGLTENDFICAAKIDALVINQNQ